MILVSSYLAGLKVKYNSTHSLNNEISKLVEENKAITIGPELLGRFYSTWGQFPSGVKRYFIEVLPPFFRGERSKAIDYIRN